jgi:hypothetical protein
MGAIFYFAANRLWIGRDLLGASTPLMNVGEYTVQIDFPADGASFAAGHLEPHPPLAINSWRGSSSLDTTTEAQVMEIRVRLTGPGSLTLADFNEETRQDATERGFALFRDYHDTALKSVTSFLG